MLIDTDKMEFTLMEKAVKSLKLKQIEEEKRRKQDEIKNGNSANKNNNQAKGDAQKSDDSANKTKMIMDNKEVENMKMKVEDKPVGESNQVERGYKEFELIQIKTFNVF